MLGNITGWHALILLAVILLLFGATRLPALARSVGQSARIFRTEVKTDKAEPAPAGAVTTAPETASLTAPFGAGAPVVATSVSDGTHGDR